MKRLGRLLLVAAAWPALACAQAAPVPISAESVRWLSPPLRLDAGAGIPPHTHPDERSTTVLSGTILVGFGDAFDEARMVAMSTGAVYVAPAGVPHYIWARDGAATYQESGIGPSATTMVGR